MASPLHTAALGLTFLLAGALGAPALATAATSQEGKTQTVKVKKKSTKVKFDKGSGETTAERDRRMQRECKGRPNAGACLGYGS